MRAHKYRRTRARECFMAKAMLAINAAMGAMQTQIIISQPIPKLNEAQTHCRPDN